MFYDIQEYFSAILGGFQQFFRGLGTMVSDTATWKFVLPFVIMFSIRGMASFVLILMQLPMLAIMVLLRWSSWIIVQLDHAIDDSWDTVLGDRNPAVMLHDWTSKKIAAIGAKSLSALAAAAEMDEVL